MIAVDEISEYGTVFRPLLVRIIEDNQFFGAEFWAALAGAIVGGMLAIGGQILSNLHARKLRLADIRVREITQGRLAIFKVVRMLSNLAAMGKHLEDGAHKAVVEEMPYLWSAVLPIAAGVERVEISPEEMHVISMLDEPSLFAKFSMLDQMHNSLIPLWEAYGRDRRQLLSKILPSTFKDGVGYIDKEPAEASELLPEVYELEELVKQMQTLTRMAFKDASEVLDKLVLAMNNRYGLSIKVEHSN